MSMPQVGAGAVAIVPTFKGFRRVVEAEAGAAGKNADKGFRRAFSKTGESAGKTTGTGFRKSFESSSTGFASKSVREIEQAVSKSARAVSTARLKEQDAAGKVRVAEAQLADARKRYASDSSQVIRAEERLATAVRQVETAQENTIDSTRALRSAQERLADSANRQGTKFVSAWKRSNDKVGDVFKGSFLGTAAANFATGAASRIGSAIGNGIGDAVSFALGTLDIASDLGESVNAVKVSYGDAAQSVMDLGKDSARTFGLSKRDLNNYAVQFSAFSKGIAGESGDVVGTFKSILGRATDFASVMNLEVADALGLFQSGLAGETEPLRKYGIDLSAAAVEAHAMATGIGDGKKELTESQKQQARYSLLLSATDAVAGDFANTSDELANKQRTQAALWDDLQAKVGTSFLPVAEKVSALLTDTLIPALDDMFTAKSPEISKAFEDAIPVLEEVAETLLPKIPELLQSFADSLPVILGALSTFGPPFIDFMGTLTTGAVQIKDFFTDVAEYVTPFLDDLGGRLEVGAGQWGAFFGAVGEFFGGIGERLAIGAEQIFGFFGGISERLTIGAEQIGAFAGSIGETIGTILTSIGELPVRVAEIFAGVGDWLIDSGKSLIRGFIDGIRSMIGAVGDAVGGVIDWARGFFPNSPAKRGPLSGAGWRSLHDSGSDVMTQWTSGFGRPDLTGALTATVGSKSVNAASAASGTSGAGSVAGGAGAAVQVDIHGEGADAVEIGNVAANKISELLGSRGE